MPWWCGEGARKRASLLDVRRLRSQVGMLYLFRLEYQGYMLPEAPPVFFQPFNKSCTKEVAERTTYHCANQNGVAGEKRWFVEDEHARAKSKPTTTQTAKQRPSEDVTNMAFFFCHCGITGHVERFRLMHSVRSEYIVLGQSLLKK